MYQSTQEAEQEPLVLCLFVVLWTDLTLHSFACPPTVYTLVGYAHKHPECSPFAENVPHMFPLGGRTNVGFFKTPLVSAAWEFHLKHTTVPRLLSTSDRFFSYLHSDDGEVILGLKREDVTLQP